MTASDAPASPDWWILTRSDYALVMAKHQANRLGFAVLLMFFQARGRFPRSPSEIDPAVVDEIAGQVAPGAPAGCRPTLSGRTAERHRAEIRALLGFRESTVADAEALKTWLRDRVAAAGTALDALVALLEARCRELRIEPPSPDRVSRIVRAAIHAHDERFCRTVRLNLTECGFYRADNLTKCGPVLTDEIGPGRR
jgi:Domain of unknown function (DUF4158)